MFAKNRFKAAVVLISLIFLIFANSSSAAGFQENYKININKNLRKPVAGKTNIPQLDKMPDLIVSSLALYSPQHNDKFSGEIKIKNVGKSAVSRQFYFSIQKLDNFNRWQRIPGSCFKVNINIKPGQTISKNFLLRYNPGDKNVKIRAYADSACENETPYVWRDIKESNESNNYSQTEIVSGFTNPKVTGIYPQSAIIGKNTLHVYGNGFGGKQKNHNVYLKDFKSSYHAVYVVKWRDNAIDFKVPITINPGKYYVCVDNVCLLSKLLTLSKKSFCSWETFLGKIEGYYNLIGEIHIDTRKPRTKCSYQNNSTQKILGAHAELTTQKLDVRNIQFHIKALGDYRYTIHDLNADNQNVRVVKSSGSQFIINIPFESSGVEAKGCFKSIAGGGWHDKLAPDIHINNLKIKIAILLTQNNGLLNYRAATSVSANIKAAKKINTAVLNLFVRHWRNRVKKGIINSMNNALNNDENTKRGIINSFLSILYIFSSPKIPSQAHFKKVEFDRNGIYTIY